MKRQRGFGAIVAIVVLVILAALSAAIVSVATTQHTTLAQDVMSARAWQAARAGNEWGLHRALRGDWTTCSSVSAMLDLRADTGFQVTVFCDSWLYNEGQDESPPGTFVARTVRIYEIRAVACPEAPCPAAGAAPGYVERTRVVIATN